MPKYITKQRKILQEYLEKRIDCELSAKKVAQDLSNEGISLSAIYRNIADLEKEKLVVQCCKEGSRELFFRYIDLHDCQESFHLSCKVCSKTEHISIEQSKLIKNEILNQFNFDTDLPSTVFYGICKDCSKLI